MRYAISFLLGFCLSGLWFGCHTLLRPKLEPFAHGTLEPFSPLLSAALPTVLVCIAAKTHPFHFSALADGRLWLITFVTVLLTCLVKRVSCPQQPVPTSGLAARCLEAACMEFPQRAMVQTFLCWYLTRRGGDEAMWASAPTNLIVRRSKNHPPFRLKWGMILIQIDDRFDKVGGLVFHQE